MRAFGTMTLAMMVVLLAPVLTFAQEEATQDAPSEAVPSKGDKSDEQGHHWRSRSGLDPETRALLEEVMVARLSKELSLDDKETVVLVRKFSEFRDEVIASRKQRIKIIRQLRGELKEGQDGKTIETLLSDMIAEDDKMHASRKSFFEHIGEDLTPWQRGRLYVFLSEFEMDMRRLIDRARHHKKGESGGKGDSGPDGRERADEERGEEAGGEQSEAP